MNRDLGIIALVIAAACLLMGGLSFLAPDAAVVAITFLAIGVVLASVGVWGLSRGSGGAGTPQPPAGAADHPRDKRPKSKISQILDGLTGFNG